MTVLLCYSVTHEIFATAPRASHRKARGRLCKHKVRVKVFVSGLLLSG